MYFCLFSFGEVTNLQEYCRISKTSAKPTVKGKIPNRNEFDSRQPRQARIIRTRFLSADFSHCRVKILVNPLGLTAFCASLCKKSAPQKICDPKRTRFSCGFLCGGCDKAFALVWQDSNLPRFRSPPFKLRLCVHFCKASALLQISRFAE